MIGGRVPARGLESKERVLLFGRAQGTAWLAVFGEMLELL